MPERALEALPRRAQIGRLRRLAEAALASYALPAPRLSLLAHRHNTLFRVSAAGQQYVLRIHRGGSPRAETIRSELAWLAALRRDTPLEVPNPIPTSAGEWVTEAGPYPCVLLGWQPGRRLLHGLTPAQMERVGALMAQLENHTSGWQRPPDFVRSRADWPLQSARWLPDPFGPEVTASIQARVAGYLSPAEMEQAITVVRRAGAAEQALGHGPDAYGLIHADLHYYNLLFARGTVRPIDFDDCGFGMQLFDLAVMLSEVLAWPQYPVMRAALLAGYRRVRPLPPEHEAHLNTFIALRRVQDMLYTPPDEDKKWLEKARRSLKPVGELLAGY